MFRKYHLKNLNIALILAVFALTIVGILIIGSADSANQSKQIMGMILGTIVMILAMLFDYHIYFKFAWPIYIFANGMLVFVLFKGYKVAGATRWIRLSSGEGGIRFQPSELAKILLILFFSWYLMKLEGEINNIKNLAIFAVLCAVPLFLIEEEPDLSTTIVTFLIMASLAYMAGLTYKIIFPVLITAIPAVVIFIRKVSQPGQTILDEYAGLRILAWLHPDKYPASSYQQQNSIMAVGSGGFSGKGLYNDSFQSVKNGNYISESNTDFIFAVAGEELGFLGSVLIIFLILLIVVLCLYMAYRASDLGGKYICTGMAALIGFQSFVNMCVVTGLMPNTGIPLPFVSSGLTSLITIYLGVGITLNVGLQAKLVGRKFS